MAISYSNMDSAFVLLLGFLGSTYVFLKALIYYTQHPKEPPAVETRIPFIGPLLCLLREGTPFFARLRSVNCEPCDDDS